jgi:hypothetical protein
MYKHLILSNLAILSKFKFTSLNGLSIPNCSFGFLGCVFVDLIRYKSIYNYKKNAIRKMILKMQLTFVFSLSSPVPFQISMIILY